MKKTKAVFVGAIVASFIGAVVACSSSTESPPADPTGSCGVLASRCHPYDKISTIGHDCHELGHAGDDKACFPKKDECLAACPETDGSTTHPKDEAGTTPTLEAGTDAPAAEAGSDPCPDHCTCLMETCATENGYPFTTVDECKTSCAGWSAEEKICLPKWCIKAKGQSNKTHTCEHAWGKLGTDECETLP